MDLVLTILFILWLFSFIKFKRAYKEYKLLVIFYRMRYENSSSQFFSDRLDVLREYGNALILAQKYSTAEDIYKEAVKLIESQPVLKSTSLANEVQINYDFCKSPLPWTEQSRNYNSSWLHNFLLVRFGRRRYMGFSEASQLDYHSWKRAMNGFR